MKGGRFNESMGVPTEARRGTGGGELIAIRAHTSYNLFRRCISRSGTRGVIFPLSLLLGTPCHPLVTYVPTEGLPHSSWNVA